MFVDKNVRREGKVYAHALPIVAQDKCIFSQFNDRYEKMLRLQNLLIDIKCMKLS